MKKRVNMNQEIKYNANKMALKKEICIGLIINALHLAKNKKRKIIKIKVVTQTLHALPSLISINHINNT